MTTIHEPAFAKINLALHVTDRRADGYHLLDSLVVFAAFGDRITINPGPLSLQVTGPFAAGLGGDDDLCLRAARWAGATASIHLDKHLPHSSGIGGGSADAAAVLRGLRRLGVDLPSGLDDLGADVPVCFASNPARMRGVGEVLDSVPTLPEFYLVLVNPGVAVSTPGIFAALTARQNDPMPGPSWRNLDDLLAYLAQTRNDLEAPAIAQAPVIGDVLSALRQQGAAFARMSGSGATCYGIFARRAEAENAAHHLAGAGWWAVATGLAPTRDWR